MTGRRRADFERLAALAAMRRDIESQELAAINAAIAGLKAQVARLRGDLARYGADLELEPARLSGADVPWMRRSEQQIAHLQMQIAGLMAQRETRIEKARMAVGKASAAEALAKRAGRRRMS